MSQKVKQSKKSNQKDKTVTAIKSQTNYICDYPDPDACHHYDDKTGCCMNTKIQCSYRTKIKKS